ncbi:MAG: M36 family metallopeptidase, partial [Actinomycetota bacterium]
RYGFTEAAGNFQVNNYGRGGEGNDSVRAEAQDGSGTNNANFATPADGSRPRMQMYMWTTGVQSQQRIIDGDVDAGVITHEYGHGISNRLTGGPNNVDCLDNQEQMGEGWSDWLATALTALPTESGPQRRGMGTYVLAEPNRQGDGIRPTPYSTDMSINPSTYDTIKSSAVPHGVGYVWASMLWEVLWNLVDKHGFNPDVYGDWSTGGNNLAIQLVMDGMKMQPCSPGFVDGRDAILAADQALTGGANQCEIWQGFAKRGLGESADQGESTSRSDGTQAFDLPGACAVHAEVTPTALEGSLPEGGTATGTLSVANLAPVEEEEEEEFTGEPQEAIPYSFGPEGAPVPGGGIAPTPQSTFEFEVLAPPEADNDAMVASMSWSVPSDYDLHLERKVGEDWVSHGCQCAFVNTGEELAVTSPPPGTWRIRLENFLGAPQPVQGTIEFSSNPPSPPGEEDEEVPGEADLVWSITETESSCGTPSDLGWVSVSPTGGRTGPGAATEVSV